MEAALTPERIVIGVKRVRGQLANIRKGQDIICVSEYDLRAMYLAIDAFHEASINTLSSLTAATSLLKRSSKKAAPSDKMFDQMILDYEKAIERGRSILTNLAGIVP